MATQVQIELTASDLASSVIQRATGALDGMRSPLGKLVDGFSRLGLMAQGVEALAQSVVGLGKALAGPAIEFEQAIDGIGAVAGATKSEMEQIEKLALQLGKDTAFSASEAAAGIEELVKGGISITDVLGGAAAAALNLAAAGGVSLADASEIAANAMAIFGIKGSEMAHVADLVAGAANASSISVEDFKYSLAQSGAVAQLVGQDMDDLAVAIAVMGANGLKGSDAGTSLKTMLMNLQPTTKSQSKAMRELGLITEDGRNQFLDASGSFKGMAEIAGILEKSLTGLTDAQKQAYLEAIFGSDAVRAAAVFAKEGAAGFSEMAAAMGKVTAESVGAARLDNVAGAIEQLKGSWETLRITMGKAFLPIIRSGLDWLTEMVNKAIPIVEAWGPKIADALGRALDKAKGAAQAGWTLGQAIVGGIVEAFKSGDFNQAFGKIITAVSQVFGPQVAGKVTLFLSNALRGLQLFRDAIITAIQAANGDWGGHNDKGINGFVRGVGIAVDWMRTTGLPALKAFGLFIVNTVIPAAVRLGKAFISDVVPQLQQFAGWITGTAIPALKQFSGWFQTNVLPVLERFGGWVKENAPGITAGISTAVVAFYAFQAVAGILAPVITILSGLVALLGGPVTLAVLAVVAVVGLLVAAWVNNWGDIQGKTEGAWAAIQPALTAFGDSIQWLWGQAQILWQVVKPVFEQMGGEITKFLDDIEQRWGPAWENIQKAAKVVFETISNIFTDHTDIWKALIAGVVLVIEGIIEMFWSSVTTMFKVGLDIIGGNWGQAWEDIKDGVEGWGKGVVNLLTGILLTIAGVVGVQLATIYEIWKTAGGAFVENLKQGIADKWGAFVNWFKDKLGGLAGLLPGSEPKDPSSPLRGLGDRGAAIFGNMADGFAPGARAATTAFSRSLGGVVSGAMAPSAGLAVGRLGAGSGAGITSGPITIQNAVSVTTDNPDTAARLAAQYVYQQSKTKLDQERGRQPLTGLLAGGAPF